jgi:hypothetical protein
MADTIIDGTLFNAKEIRYSAPKANASGGKSINILNKATNSGIRLSTPLMLTWGASDFVDQASGKGNGKFEMSMQFPSEEYKTEDTTAFLKNMQAFEAKIKDDALVNSKDWFGKVHKNAEVVDALYTPMLKYSKDKASGEPDLNRAPVLRVKIPMWEGSWKCEVYDEDGEKLFPNSSNPILTPVELIQKGTQVAALIQCGGLWFANGKFGVTWKLIQVVVQKPRASLSGQCFIKLKSSDKERLKAAPAPSGDIVDDEDAVHTAEVEDSDEESDDDDEPVSAPVVPPPTPAPVLAPVVVAPPAAVVVEEPKKKKVVKKKVLAEA